MCDTFKKEGGSSIRFISWNVKGMDQINERAFSLISKK